MKKRLGLALQIWYDKSDRMAAAVPKEGEMRMDVQIGDILTMKKPHPCGSKQWKVLRTGMDFKLKCMGCGHEVMLPRAKAEKNIRVIEREGKPVC